MMVIKELKQQRRESRRRISPRRRATVQRTSITDMRKKVQSEKQFVSQIRQDVVTFVNSFNSLSQAEQGGRTLILQNLNSLDPKYRTGYISFVNNEINKIKQSQNQQMATLRQKIATAEAKRSATERERRRLKSRGERETSYEDGIIAQQKFIASESRKILNRLSGGEFLDQSRINTFITSNAKLVFQDERQRSGAEAERERKLSLAIDVGAKQRKAVAIETRQIVTDKNLLNKYSPQFVSEVDRISGAFFTGYEERKTDDKLFITNFFIKSRLEGFDKLSKIDKAKVYAYAYLKNAKNQMPSQQQIGKVVRETQELNRITGGLTNPALKNIIKEIENKQLTFQDANNLNALRNISDKRLQEMILRSNQEDVKKLNNQVNSFNKYYDNVEQNSQRRFKNLIKLSLDKIAEDINAKQILRSTKKRVFIQGYQVSKTGVKIIGIKIIPKVNPLLKIVFNAVKPFRFLLYVSYITDLTNKLKKGYQLSETEYKNYKENINDLLGADALTKQFSKKLEKNFGKGTARGFYLTALGFAKFTYAVGKATIQITIRDISFLLTILKDLGAWAGRTSIGFGKDIYDLSDSVSRKMRKLPPKERTLIFKRTLTNIKPILKGVKTVADLTKTIIDNPVLLLIGSAMLISLGARGIRKGLVSNRVRFAGEIASIFLTSKVIQLAGKGVILIKAKFSPFVIRNVKVFSDSASLTGSGQALKQLEGKRINLFSTTTSHLKELFKNTPISKTEEVFLIKQMLKNPTTFMGSNFKIRPLRVIANSFPRTNILNYMGQTGRGVLTGSGSLKLQLKTFRKIGDLDIFTKNPKKFAQDIITFLNKKTLLGRLTKIQRYKIFKDPKYNVYKIWDGLGRKKFSKKYLIADIEDIKLVETNIGRIIKSSDIRIIKGIKVFKIETQMIRKIAILSDSSASLRFEKELKDLRLILKGINKKISGKKNFKLVKRLLDKETGLLKVRGFGSESGLDRRYNWAKRYFPDLRLPFGHNNKLEQSIRRRLMKIGFSPAQIDKNVRIYNPTDMYFAPDVIYSYYLKGGKGGFVYVKNVKISSYPKNIQALLKQNFAGSLGIKEQAKLRGLMRLYRIKNPNKVFVGEKALADRFGEFEILAPEYTKLFSKKTLIKREVYVPVLEKFITIQEATIGKRPPSVLRKLGIFLKTKSTIRKGSSLSRMRSHLKTWASKNLDDFKTKFKPVSKIERRKVEAFIRKQKFSLNKEISAVRKSKLLTVKQKKTLIKSLQRDIQRMTPDRVRGNRIAVINRNARTLRRAKQLRQLRRVRPIKRKVKARKVVRKVKPRKPITRKPAPRRATKRIVSRVPLRPVKPRPPIRPIPPRKPPKIIPPKGKPPIIPRFKLSFRKKLPRGKVLVVDAIYRRRGKRVLRRLKTTPNRAMRIMINFIDKSLARSFQLIIVGVKRGKDIKRPSLIKFKLKVLPQTLLFVEKTQFINDTPEEKLKLRLARKQSKKKPKPVKKKSKLRKKKPKPRKKRRSKSKPKKTKRK